MQKEKSQSIGFYLNSQNNLEEETEKYKNKNHLRINAVPAVEVLIMMRIRVS